MLGKFGRKAIDPKGFSYQQTMYRIKDPAVTIPFYQKHFGMTCIAERHFPQWKFSLYFLATLPAKTVLPFAPDSDEAMVHLNQISYTVLELTHNHGTETDPAFAHHNGNTDPRGFGHIGFIVDDVVTFCDGLL